MTTDKATGKKTRGRISIRSKATLQIMLLVIIIFVITLLSATRLHSLLTIETALVDDMWAGNYLARGRNAPALAKIFEQGRDIYNSLSEEERKDPLDKNYQSKYDALITPEYQAIYDELFYYAEFKRFKWVDLRIKDKENNRFIYLLDTDPEESGIYDVGYWELDDGAHAGTFVGDEGENEFLSKLPEFFYDIGVSVTNLVEIEQKLNGQRVFVLLYPYYHPDTGEQLGYIGIGESVIEYEGDINAFPFVFIIIMIFSLIIVTILVRNAVNRQIINPIIKLSNSARDYISDEEKIGSGEYFKGIDIHTNDELEELKDSMAVMEDKLMVYMNHLTSVTAEKERLSAEFELASGIQSGMLPKGTDGLDENRDFEITAFLKSAKEVSGDYYDYFKVDDERTGIVIADVSGKGVPAALFMMVAKILLLVEGKRHKSPRDAIREVNRMLCENNSRLMFVTVWFGYYDRNKKTVTYVSAGHEYPAVYRAADNTFSLIQDIQDPPIAISSEVDYVERVLTLAPGDKLFLYTDGIPEANNEKDQMYGNDRMIESLTKNHELSGEEFLNAVYSDVKEFVGEAEQFDDMTMLLLEV